MSNKFIAMAGLSLLVLGGCAPPDSLSPDFGNSVRHNMAAQVVNPTPRASTAAPEMDGGRAALAHQRYQVGRVKEPKPESTRKSAKSN